MTFTSNVRCVSAAIEIRPAIHVRRVCPYGCPLPLAKPCPANALGLGTSSCSPPTPCPPAMFMLALLPSSAAIADWSTVSGFFSRGSLAGSFFTDGRTKLWVPLNQYVGYLRLPTFCRARRIRIGDQNWRPERPSRSITHVDDARPDGHDEGLDEDDVDETPGHGDRCWLHRCNECRRTASEGMVRPDQVSCITIRGA